LLFATPVLILFDLGCSRESGTPSTQGVRQDRINIGAILPLTGDNAAWGKQARDTLELAVNHFNESEPTLSVEIGYQDTQADPKQAVSAARLLITTKSA